MSTNGTPKAISHRAASGTLDPAENTIHATIDAPEQLSLLGAPSVPLQFRLDERTRRNGLQHVAELRALMAAQVANRRTATGRSGTQSGRRTTERQIAA